MLAADRAETQEVATGQRACPLQEEDQARASCHLFQVDDPLLADGTYNQPMVDPKILQPTKSAAPRAAVEDSVLKVLQKALEREQPLL
ncbi:hypothetical protein [Mesorhizobium sp. L-2-11]|uniref:hypothetical protein n=1 Tax=Mesorhizobium sp. L-2-11 TaxID=2744521 RepID=UPI0019267B38|nr:hypothetical protein [Mesorhizobium sp. L-2-11]BCH15377.1 hypothetical protein MesoLjLa_22280 [Mesorhizobium sp. L-2-11]